MAFVLFKNTDNTLIRTQYFNYDVNVVDVNTGDNKRHRKNIPIRLPEELLSKVEFTVFKFNNRPKPKVRKRCLIISCFSEFGCETVGTMYCIPRIIKRSPGLYIIAMGWYGREYLYRNLVDEFWEIKEDYMWLRDYSRAFHHLSTNLKNVEEGACVHGTVVPSATLGTYAVGNSCKTCGKFWNEWEKYHENCPSCGSTLITRSLFTDIKSNKSKAVLPPKPSQAIKDWAKTILKPNSVGIFARGRKTYGRNLSPDFYIKLINLIEKLGYNIIWLGEKQSSQPCPVDHIMDFSRMPESRDLEKTLAIVSCLSFTIQFWTASTRLSGMVGTPFLLFESPEQIYSSDQIPGQEGRRLELTSFGPKKICISHYERSCANPEETLNLVNRCINEMKVGDFSDVLGLVDTDSVSLTKNKYYERIK